MHVLNLNPEELFILQCCRQIVRGGLIEAIQERADQRPDWRLIERMILRHGIAGAVHGVLAHCDNPSCIPADMLERLKLRGLQTAFRNYLFCAEFNALVRACNREHIRLLPLKGISFLTSLYAHNTALRSLSDIDILVEKKDVTRLEDILVAMGYKRKPISVYAASRAYHFKYQRRISGFPVIIEVHRDVDYRDSFSAIDISECWKRSREIAGESGAYYEFSIEDNLIFNCFHIVHHVAKGSDTIVSLKNFCDVALMLSQHRNEMDWECILQRSRDYNVLRPVSLALMLVHELLMVDDIPMAIFETLQREGFQEDFAEYMIRQHIFNLPQPEAKIMPFWLVDFATARGIRGKINKFKDVPKVFISLCRARYYSRMGQSTPRTIVHVIWYYVQKAATTMLVWVRTPRRTARLHDKMVAGNRKTQAIIDWLQH